VLGVLAVSQHHAHAQTKYPDRAVRIVVPFAAGGVADITARIVAEKLGDRSASSLKLRRTRRRLSRNDN
jgi:tripartite-type tricarboxylate transporter receptor subunit TctC